MSAVPTFGGDLLQRTDRPDQTGVVEGAVETAEFADRTDDQRLNIGLGCDVGLLEHGAASILLALTHSRRAAFLIGGPRPRLRRLRRRSGLQWRGPYRS